jgi:hypothetical protein
MHFLKLSNQVAKTIMLKLAQQSVRDIGGDVATTSPFANLGRKASGDGC